jgi:hypothetical protein
MNTLYTTCIGGNGVHRLFGWSNLRVLPDLTLAESWPRPVVIFVYEKYEHTLSS